MQIISSCVCTTSSIERSVFPFSRNTILEKKKQIQVKNKKIKINHIYIIQSDTVSMLADVFSDISKHVYV